MQRTRVNLQLTRRLFLRTVVEYDDFGTDLDVEPLLSYKVNPFTVLYLGSAHLLDDYGHGDDGLRQLHRQFFLKVQCLFQA